MIDKILEHAKQEYPRESCGVVIIFKGREKYIPCRNTAEGQDHFIIHHEDYSNAEDMGEIIKIVHSHPSTNPQPSQPDLVGIEESGVPWIIINPLTEQWTETKPSGYKAPLVGRVFSPGILDCYSIIRDYYKEELRIDLIDFERVDNWWDKGQNLYVDNFEKAGFIQVNDLKEHDVIIMYNGSNIPNHGAVYLGNGTILHHPQGRLSSRDVYGGYWLKNTKLIVRHKQLL